MVNSVQHAIWRGRVREQQPFRGVLLFPAATLSGTATGGISESDVIAGGKTIIITLRAAAWIAAGALSFDLIRQDIIDGFVSAQSETFGWNNTVRALQGVSGVVRTSDSVVTLTLDAQALHDITAQETITGTVPSSALTSGGPLVATPTFTVSVGAALVRIFNEIEQIVEQTLRRLAMTRQQNETVQILEQMQRPLALTRRLNEVEQIVEQILRRGSLLRTLNETVNIGEQIQRLKTLLIRMNEVVNIQEAVLTLRGFTRIFNETVQIVENLVRRGSLVRGVNETVQIVEGLLRRLAITRQMNETVQIVETLARRETLTRLFNETVQIVEGLTALRAMKRVLSETVEIGEGLARKLSGPIIKVLSETVQIVDASLLALTPTLRRVLAQVVRTVKGVAVSKRGFVAYGVEGIFSASAKARGLVAKVARYVTGTDTQQ